MLIDAASEPALSASNADDCFVSVPFFCSDLKTPATQVGKALTGCHSRQRDGLMTDLNVSGPSCLFDYAEGEWKPEVHPYSIADSHNWDAVAGATGMTGRLHGPAEGPILILFSRRACLHRAVDIQARQRLTL
jgi:hypothetical protein